LNIIVMVTIAQLGALQANAPAARIEPGSIASSPVGQAQPASGPATGAQPAASPEQADQRTIVVSARQHHAPGDPMEAVNAKSYAVTQSVDKAVVGPIAMGYRHIVPSPLRSGLHNAITNLREPTIFLNYLLQIKPGKAAETLGRFAINSTLGIAGFVDVAKRHPFSLPHRPNGFADSFGYYGIKPGPYMFLPLVGPTTLRDLIGGGLDRLVLPIAVGQPFNKMAYSIPTGVVSALDHRVEIDEQLHRIRGSDNPYAAMRTDYLHHRQAEIDGLKGKTVTPGGTLPTQ
jgi:phospholipid-binding lipoprotein MlaA